MSNSPYLIVCGSTLDPPLDSNLTVTFSGLTVFFTLYVYFTSISFSCEFIFIVFFTTCSSDAFTVRLTLGTQEKIKQNIKKDERIPVFFLL